jgi:hypothetical protein
VPTLRAIDAPTTDVSRWYRRAISACDPFIFPESRYRTLWMDDDLARSLESACKWLRENPCPDSSLGHHLQAMFDAYAHMATAPVARVKELREVIESHGGEVDRRRAVRS